MIPKAIWFGYGAPLSLFFLFLGPLGAQEPIVESAPLLDKGQISPGASVSLDVSSSGAERSATIALRYEGVDEVVGDWSYSVHYVITPGDGTEYELVLSSDDEQDIYESVGQHELEESAEPLTVSLEVKSTPPAPGNVPHGITLSLAVETEPMADFDPTSTDATPALSVVFAPNSDDGHLSWTEVDGATRYQLEWVFVDACAPSPGSDPFRSREPTRVELPDSLTSYPLERNYPQGRIHYRVRALGPYRDSEPNAPRYGRRSPWSNTEMVRVAPEEDSGACGAAQGDLAPLEPDKNWQLAVSFAEGGKQQQEITYFDGLLRERQILWASRADSVVLVEERKFDHEGRPTLSTLPAPVLGTALNYQVAFSTNASGDPVSASDFNEGLVNPFGKTTGAGQYYSTENPWNDENLTSYVPDAESLTSYVPDAGGYPYEVQEYTRDNTGRIRRASGVGESLRPDGDHVTQFDYGTPSTTELVRLFGSNVGPARHYKRNVVRDPNSQGTVSYMDRRGRTIATALVGSTPDPLEPLSGNVEESLARNLNDDNVIDIASMESRSVSRIVNSEPQTEYHFEYTFTGANYDVPLPGGDTHCASCSYELSIQIRNPDGEAIDLTLPDDSETDNVQAEFSNPDMCAPGDYGSETLTFEATFGEIGEYEVQKVLRVDDGAVDLTVTETLAEANLPGLEFYRQKIDEEIDQDATCALTCEDHCRAAGGDTELTDCVDLCEQLVDNSVRDLKEAECASYENAFRADFRPPDGWISKDEEALEDVISKIETPFGSFGNRLISGDERNLVVHPDGDATVYEDGETTPYTSVRAALSEQWDEGWAEELSLHHPERCHLDFCETMIDSEVFDAEMGLVESYSDAKKQGFLKPFHSGAVSICSGWEWYEMAVGGIPGGGVRRLDPYFWTSLSSPGRPERCELIHDLVVFVSSDDEDSTQSLWEYVADPVAHLGTGDIDDPEVSTALDELNGEDHETCDEDLDFDSPVPCDARWRLFRSIYLGLKKDLYHDRLRKRDQTEQCPFLDKPNAHYEPPPPVFDTPEAVQEYGSEEFADFCQGDEGNGEAASFCEIRAEEWTNALTDICEIEDEVVGNVEDLLAEYCGESCGLDNPFAQITPDVLEQGHPALTEVQELLGSCAGLDSIAVEDSMQRERICREECTDTLVPHGCVGTLLNLLDRNLPVAADAVVPLEADSLGSAFLQCLPEEFVTLTDIYLNPRSIGLGSEGKGVCGIQFLTANGADVPPHAIEGLQDARYESHAPSGAGISELPADWRFANVSVEVDVVGSAQPVRAYLVTNCPFPSTAECVECEVAQKPVLRQADEDGEVAARRVPPADSTRTVEFEESGQLDFTPVQNYEAVSVREALDAAGEAGCAVTATTALGQILDPDDYTVTGDLFPAPYPGPPTVSVPYTGFAVQVYVEGDDAEDWLRRILGQEGSQIAYIFSECKVAYEDDCKVVPTGIETDSVPDVDYTELCKAELEERINWYAEREAEEDRDELENEVWNVTANRCLEQPFEENFEFTATTREYVYTLSYYDQAGNRVQTVPPEGVDVLSAGAVTDHLSGAPNPTEPDHRLRTTYRYNSRNQVIWKQTPDGGITQVWFNREGQQRLSQDPVQADADEYSFTRYDRQGRVVENGVLEGPLEDAVEEVVEMDDFPDPDTYTLRHVVRTIYDQPAGPVCTGLDPQRNLRGRVAARIREPTAGSVSSATCYSYDAHGNVERMLQTIEGLGPKRIAYRYDLLGGGHINEVRYQEGEADQFFHRYDYDRDNRLTAVWTSRDGVLWDRDAKYSYYLHGPLARVELGDAPVQGLDHVYTVQGWKKSVNSNTLDPQRDPGQDGAGADPAVPADVFGFTLGYFDEDYAPADAALNGQSSFEAQLSGSFADDAPEMFDGTLSHMVLALAADDAGIDPVVGTAFRQDQLYRLTSTRPHFGVDVAANEWSSESPASGDLGVTYQYDRNGNILRVSRNAKANSAPAGRRLMDSLTYHYPRNQDEELISNRLLHVSDSVSDASHAGDLDDQGDFPPAAGTEPNYVYDALGRVVKDHGAEIDTVIWNAENRVQEVRKVAGNGPNLSFMYDPEGRRIAKVQQNGNSEDEWEYTYYVRGPDGAVLAVYDRIFEDLGQNQEFKEVVRLREVTLQGRERLGLVSLADTTREVTFSASTDQDGRFTNVMADEPSVREAPGTPFTRVRGKKRFELADHLGNVSAVLTDRVIAVDTDGDGNVDEQRADPVSFTRYYPFGQVAAHVEFPAVSGYPYGFNGQRMDNDVKGFGNSYDFGARWHDPRVGRFMSQDPLAEGFPQYSPYIFAGNKPSSKVDLNGEQACGGNECEAAARPADEAEEAEEFVSDFISAQASGFNPENAARIAESGIEDLGVVRGDVKMSSVGKLPQRLAVDVATEAVGEFKAPAAKLLRFIGFAAQGVMVVWDVTGGVVENMARAQREKKDFSAGARYFWEGHDSPPDDASAAFTRGFDTARRIKFGIPRY